MSDANGNGKIVVSQNLHLVFTLGTFLTVISACIYIGRQVERFNVTCEMMKRHCEIDWTVYEQKLWAATVAKRNPAMDVPDVNDIVEKRR